MPLAWFSEREYKVYHICLNCPYRAFARDTFVVGDEDDIWLGEKLRLCLRCYSLAEKGECEFTESYFAVRKRILQNGRRRTVERYAQWRERETKG